MEQKRPWFQWYRVSLNTIVRKGVELESERLRILPMGSRVRVVDMKDRRVKIDRPLTGWCSVTSSNGDAILSPIDKEQYLESDTEIGESASEEVSDHEESDLVRERPTLGWHRVCLNTIVRSTADLVSERRRILPMGSRVHIVETLGRRCKIDDPIDGWVSVESSNADIILSPIEPDRVYDRTHFSPNAAKDFSTIFGAYVCDELGWLQGDEIFVMIVSFLTDPNKHDTDKHAVVMHKDENTQTGEKRIPGTPKRGSRNILPGQSNRIPATRSARSGINTDEIQENGKVNMMSFGHKFGF